MLKIENNLFHRENNLLNDGSNITYKLQSVLGSMVKPKTMPQKPDKVEMAVAFEL